MEHEIKALIDSLDHPDPTVWLTAKHRLMKAGPEACLALVEALRSQQGRKAWIAANLMGLIGNTRCVPDLLKLIDVANPVLRNEVITALGMLKDHRATLPLCASLNHHSELTRIAAAKALGELTDPRAVPVLIEAVQKDIGESLRYTMIEALGNLGDPAALPVIRKFASDSNYHVRERAEIAIRKLINHNHTAPRT